MLQLAVESLRLAPGLADCPKIIVCDGCRVQKDDSAPPKHKMGLVSRDSAAAYARYKRRVVRLAGGPPSVIPLDAVMTCMLTGAPGRSPINEGEEGAGLSNSSDDGSGGGGVGGGSSSGGGGGGSSGHGGSSKGADGSERKYVVAAAVAATVTVATATITAASPDEANKSREADQFSLDMDEEASGGRSSESEDDGENQCNAARGAFRSARVVLLPIRQGFGYAVLQALNKVDTKYALVMQHDYPLVRPFDAAGLLAAMEDPVLNLRCASLLSSSTLDYERKMMGRHRINLYDGIRKHGGFRLVPLAFWFDKPHICDVAHYRRLVFGEPWHVRRGQFIEDTFGHVMLADIKANGLAAHAKYGAYVADDGAGRPMVGHAHGRRWPGRHKDHLLGIPRCRAGPRCTMGCARPPSPDRAADVLDAAALPRPLAAAGESLSPVAPAAAAAPPRPLIQQPECSRVEVSEGLCNTPQDVTC
ncbi:unnamed protein product [Phaeothamnion confervicola]